MSGSSHDQLRWERPVLAVSLALALTAALTDLLIGAVSDFWVDHAMLAGLVSGGLIVPPLLIVIERFVARRDQRREHDQAARELERWRPAASLAAEVYLDDHLRIDEEFEAKLATVLAEHGIGPLGDNPYSPAEYRVKFAMLAEREPARFQSVAEWLWQGYDDIGRSILSVMPTVALYPPLQEQFAHLDRTRAFTEARRSLGAAAAAAAELSKPGLAPDELQAAAQRLGDAWVNFRSGYAALTLELLPLLEEIRGEPTTTSA